MNNTFVLETNSGLCNRLRAVFSYYISLKNTNTKMIVIWKPDIHCPGYFLDYFKPVPGVTFLRQNNGLKVNKKTCGAHSKFNPNDVDNKDLNIFRYLEPLPKIKSKVIGLLKKYNKNYIATHIRRTDHKGVIDRRDNGIGTTNNVFRQFINLHKNKNLYIATDCKNTQNMFYNMYKNRIKYIKKITGNNFRQTSLYDAVVDLYMCQNASVFKGTICSSFSGIISYLRHSKRKFIN